MEKKNKRKFTSFFIRQVKKEPLVDFNNKKETEEQESVPIKICTDNSGQVINTDDSN